MIAAVYWSPGWLKFKMDWYTLDQVRYMPLAAYIHGWLTTLNLQQIVSYAQFIAQFEKAVHIFVLGFELVALVCFWRHQFNNRQPVSLCRFCLIRLFNVGLAYL